MSTEVSEGPRRWYFKWHNLEVKVCLKFSGTWEEKISVVRSYICWPGKCYNSWDLYQSHKSNDVVLMESITDWTINWVSIDINGDATLRDVLQFERCNFCGKGKWPILIDKYWQCWEILEILLWSIVNENTIYCQ